MPTLAQQRVAALSAWFDRNSRWGRTPNGGATVNLKGPIVVNRHTLRGKQVIPTNAPKFALQHPLPVAKQP